MIFPIIFEQEEYYNVALFRRKLFDQSFHMHFLILEKGFLAAMLNEILIIKKARKFELLFVIEDIWKNVIQMRTIHMHNGEFVSDLLWNYKEKGF